MKNCLKLLSVISLLAFLSGCAGKKEEETEVKTSAPINNNAPGAKDAPPAPSDPSIPYPGGKRKSGSK
ncbi:MAG: hypothetical protein H7308_04105 [Chthonomonadaceae bacterium]|nr:hypothetical protein [Chthonomonadaceae bacterium]